MSTLRRTAAAAVLLAAGAAAVPAHAAVQPDTSTGKGYTRALTSFSFTAREQLGQLGPSGSANFVNPLFTDERRDRSGPVVCARIEGKRALFGIEDVLPDGSKKFRTFYVEDRGTPAKNGPGVDRVAQLRATRAKPTSTLCGEFPALGRGLIIRSGNIVVTDRPNGMDVARVL